MQNIFNEMRGNKMYISPFRDAFQDQRVFALKYSNEDVDDSAAHLSSYEINFTLHQKD